MGVRPSPEGWSVLEHLGHVSDVLELFARRIRTLLGTTGIELEVMDQTASTA